MIQNRKNGNDFPSHYSITSLSQNHFNSDSQSIYTYQTGPKGNIGKALVQSMDGVRENGNDHSDSL